ncbi:hypothetical protein [Neobacillus cucumis]|nr:hypothetical protein [Neobacillus cucumis]MDR4950177.1 hypothetical protein [Neobacillus cucumis]
MEKVNSNEVKNENSKKPKVFEEVKRKNFMDWGVIELAEGVQQSKTRKD